MQLKLTAIINNYCVGYKKQIPSTIFLELKSSSKKLSKESLNCVTLSSIKTFSSLTQLIAPQFLSDSVHARNAGSQKK